MMNNLPFIQFSMMLLGLIFIWIAFTKRTKEHPWYSNVNPVYILKRKSWYSPAGYIIHLTGFIMFYLGLALGGIFYLFKIPS